MTRHQKSISSPKTFPIKRKGKKWTIKPSSGPHSEDDCIPLAIVVRDVLGYADSIKEVKKIINEGKCEVDLRTVNDHRFPLGTFDSLKLGEEFYRIVPSKKGFKLVEIGEKDVKRKLCRIEDKRKLRGGKTQLNLSDGKNILTDRENVDTDSSILLDLEEMKIEDVIKLEEGSKVMITRGKNRGKIADFKKLKVVKGSKPNRVIVEWEGEEIDLPEDLIFPVGKDKPAVNIGEQDAGK